MRVINDVLNQKKRPREEKYRVYVFTREERFYFSAIHAAGALVTHEQWGSLSVFSRNIVC